MEFIETPLPGLLLIKHAPITDERGFFMRTFCKNEFAAVNFQKEFVQFNHSFNKEKGTLRGLHFQEPPYTETKLIRCIQGKVYDVAVDLRKESPTFLQYFGVELGEDKLVSILIPDGFAHGFQTLQDNSALIYHHTAFFTPAADKGIRFNDPAIGIQWQLPPVNLSKKDTSYPLITENFKGVTL